MKKRRLFGDIFAYIILCAVGISMLVPFCWMIITSLRDKTEFFREITGLLPTGPHWSNYIDAWTTMPFGRYFFNSFFVAVVVTFGQMITCSFAAYAFARLKFRGREPLFKGYLSTMMIPQQVTLIPLFLLMVKFRWLDSYYALIVPFLVSAYGCFLLKQFFLTIPEDLEDAARIDGASHWSIFWRIILPLSKPALAAFGVFTFLASWNSFIWPLIVISRPTMKTLPIGLQALQGFYGDGNWAVLMAGSVIAALPMIVIFLFAQRYFIEGITLTGIKG
ncbi:MAG TPA: carbohydrate ABC transporter permease [Armatimonadota bacterium]|nr:carbohydrate ABC transporter permease [Armatimonadota bacterium]HOP80329.1 carbohydrate ABC transporter permease [Armatimonadota bacterium]HPP74056.1 carbohydrate ABC transporter permease [Armatimonadota bacterium]